MNRLQETNLDLYGNIPVHCSDFICNDNFHNRTVDTFALAQVTKTG